MQNVVQPTVFWQLVEALEADKKKPTFNLAAISQETGIEYDDVQIAAIRQAVESKVMILTGGPGTGKTTTTTRYHCRFENGRHEYLACRTDRKSRQANERGYRHGSQNHPSTVGIQSERRIQAQ